MSRGAAHDNSSPLTDAEATALFEPLLKHATGVLIAVSGGPDSMALMALLAQWKDHPPLAAATVDHGLRPEAASEAAVVAASAKKLDIAHRTLVWTGRKPAAGLQQAAREARYTLLIRQAKNLGFSHLVTAHHADDQAETVLMRLTAGSGIGGLAGMRGETLRDGVTHARPLLTVAKRRLVATCETRGLAVADDPSNRDARFGRARLRRILDALAPEGLGPERLNRLAQRAARAEEALSAMAKAALAAAQVRTTDCVTRAEWRAIASEPAEIRLRVLVALLRQSGIGQDHLRLERIETLLAALDEAFGQGARLRRSIGDRIVTLLAAGVVTVGPAPERKRGTKVRHGS
jgi:tRNA(Ile)-lysidine synthase